MREHSMTNALHVLDAGGRQPASLASLAVAIAVALAATPSASAQVRYLATPIGQATTALGINAYGDVVGSVATPEGKRAFLWSDGTLQLLGTLGGAHSGATAISDRREVVGEAETAAGETHAFLWRHGAMQDLGVLPGHRKSSAAGVNNFGRVVGASYVGGTSYEHRAFLHDGWSMIDLGTLGGRDSHAAAINDWGQVVGDASDGTSPRAFLYSGGRDGSHRWWRGISPEQRRSGDQCKRSRRGIPELLPVWRVLHRHVALRCGRGRADRLPVSTLLPGGHQQPRPGRWLRRRCDRHAQRCIPVGRSDRRY
jgi:probable HAF family extracellular repeat protein